MTLGDRVPASLRRAQRQVFAAHRGDLHFTGSGVGYRRRGGEVTDEPVVIAMVTKKRPEASVSRMRLLPRAVEIAGRSWGVDVVEAGPVTASGLSQVSEALDPARAASTPQSLVRPPLQGCSISNVNNGDTGTLGCIVIDNTDSTYCVLSSSHVLARYGSAVPNEVIIQPSAEDGGSAADGIATLKRSIVPATTGSNPVDAAIAQLTVQLLESANVVGGLMQPISASHPAVGMVVADDSAACGRNCFLSRMDTTLSKLNVSLLSGSAAVAAPTVGMSIEKAGRTSGYTSTTIDAIGAQVKVTFPSAVVTMSDLIWTQGLSVDGDSGAVACKGGNAGTWAALPSWCLTPGPCGLLTAIGTYYNLPLTTSANLTLADELRDRFLAMSHTGQLLIGLTYLNAQTIIDRLQASTGSAHNQSVAQTRAQSLYSFYHDIAATLATSSSPTATVTSSDVNAAASVLYGLAAPTSAGGTAMLTTAESAAAWLLYSQLVKPTVGMNRQQLIAYMNESSVYQKVHSRAAAVPTIQVTGTVTGA